MGEEYIDTHDFTTIEKEGNRFRFTNHFDCLMSRTKMKQNLKSLQKNIDTINKELDNIKTAKSTLKIEKDCENEFKRISKQLETFDNDFDENIKTMIESKEETKNKLQGFLSNFDAYKKGKLLKEIQSQAEKAKDFVIQLQDDEKSVKLYKDAI